ncbi:MAG: flagellar basal body-associated FliL family protein [Rhodospirillaceae bacterium]|nr:flagellar basal body-associated FliL family protein [Rhodospirillaceae bacterium]
MAAAAAVAKATSIRDREDAADAGEAVAAQDVEGGAKKAGSSRRKLLLIAAPLALLVLGGAGAYLTGMAGALLGGPAGGDSAAEEPVGTFYDLPEMLVNLSTNGKKLGFLKLRVSLELADPAATEKIAAVLPRIVDSFQTYLRGLRMEDLNGSAGLYRLREELLLRVSAAVKPVEVKDVLFKEMLVQ